MALPMPRLSIVIVSHNSREDLDACLGSLTAGVTIDHEVVVVDSGSRDGTQAHVRDRWPGVRLIDAGDNIGFARANNVGIRQTSGELVLLLNPDTILTAGAIDTLIAVLDGRPDTAVAGPRIVDATGAPELSFGSMISPRAELIQKLLVTGHARQLPVVSSLVDRMTRRRREVDWVSGACLLARRLDLEAVGLFDERYFLYTEDVDLCAAIRRRGRRVIFVPDAHIVHLRGRSRARAGSAADVAYRRSHVAFYEKHHPRWAPVLRAYLKLRGKLPD